MYPKEIIWGLTLYDIMLALAVVTAMLIFSRFSNKRHLSARLHNFVLADAVVTVIVGYFFAVLFQAVYNLIASGSFELNENTGATFLGGFVGGAGVLFAFWFGVGAAVFKNRDREHIKELPELIEVFSVCVPKYLVSFSSLSPFALHLGQTGSTPRHAKGLATCCHGEEPHVVGWRFINERRAVNLDANCGWAQGKADVLYVADAFAVMKKVNELLG